MAAQPDAKATTLVVILRKRAFAGLITSGGAVVQQVGWKFGTPFRTNYELCVVEILR
jgi:hypothetical protein